MSKPEPIEVFDDSDDAEATPRKCVTKASHTTPPKKRGTLTSLWQIKTEKAPLIPESHRKLVAALGEKDVRRFYESLEEAKLFRTKELAGRQQHRDRESRAGKAYMTPPEEARRGVKRGPSVGGRPRGRARVYERSPQRLSALRTSQPAYEYVIWRRLTR